MIKDYGINLKKYILLPINVKDKILQANSSVIRILQEGYKGSRLTFDENLGRAY